jgi:hypothetical protein
MDKNENGNNVRCEMKKVFILTSIVILILAVTLSANYRRKADFLATAVDVAAGVTKVNGTDFTSNLVRVSYQNDPDIVAITIKFTRAAGSASTVDFEFQSSYDGGTTWSTAYYIRIQVPTNETAVSNVVRVMKPVYAYGISTFRLYRIVNNDASNGLTACNATLSL